MNEKTIIKDMYNTIELPESNLSEGVLSQIHGEKKITRRRAFRPVWVQDGILVHINPSRCTYDELIEFAEAFIQ